MSSKKVLKINKLQGTIKVSGDKSISHRALILGGLCDGGVTVQGLLDSDDVGRTAAILGQLGVSIDHDHDHDYVHGVGMKGLVTPTELLYCGNSGTTLRLMTGLLAGASLAGEFSGDASLNRRPMGRVLEPLNQMGGKVSEYHQGKQRLIRVEPGDLHGIEYESPVASAQVKTAILLAGLAAQQQVQIREPFSSRDHTERMLDYLGASIEWGGGLVTLNEGSRLQAKDIMIPGDFSSAAFFIVAALIVPNSELRLEGVGINPTRSALLEVLTEMGGNIQVEDQRELNGEPIADLVVRASQLTGVSVGGEQIPQLIDEIPILSIAAARAQGETSIRGAEELRVKESDRLKAIATELGRLGVPVEEFPDGLTITGTDSFQGGEVKSYGDHRMAMALTVAGSVATDSVLIDDFSCVAISYPTFWNDWESVIS